MLSTAVPIYGNGACPALSANAVALCVGGSRSIPHSPAPFLRTPAYRLSSNARMADCGIASKSRSIVYFPPLLLISAIAFPAPPLNFPAAAIASAVKPFMV